MKDLENITGMSSAASLVSKQFKLFWGKSAQTPGKTDPTTREETLLWWAEQKSLTHAIFTANCEGERL